MILNIHSEALYLSAPKACSCGGGYFFLGSIPHDGDLIKLNGAIHISNPILKLVAAFAAEADLGALFLNAQAAKVLRLILAKLGHPQPPTPIHIDNTTTVGIINNRIKRLRSRAIEMRYCWLLLDGKNAMILNILLPTRAQKHSKYPFKHHTANIHQHIRPYYSNQQDSSNVASNFLVIDQYTMYSMVPHLPLAGFSFGCRMPADKRTKMGAMLSFWLVGMLLATLLLAPQKSESQVCLC
jgi:hypothetical protein